MNKSLLLAFSVLCTAVIPADARKKDDAAVKSAPAALPAATASAAAQTLTPDTKAAKREIEDMKSQHGKAKYVGEGVATIREDVDIGQAKRLAKERALTDMLGAIKIRVKAVVVDELKYSEGSGSSEKFERLIESYIDRAVDIVQDKYYVDYPRPGDITEVVHVSKDEYDKSVARDMQAKTDGIRKYAVEGSKALAAGKVNTAIENFVKGKNLLKKYFEDLPVKADMTRDGKPEDLGSFFETNLTRIFHDIKLDPLDDNVIYNTDGKVSRKPAAVAYYESGTGKMPLADIPVKASFSKGSGTIAPTPLRTGRHGEVYIPLERVDPGEREAVLLVELDAAAMRLKDEHNLPNTSLTVKKCRAIAWAANLFTNGRRANSYSLSEAVKMLLASANYELKSFEIAAPDPTDSEIAAARALNVDYLIYVAVTASSRADEYGMFAGEANSRAYIYSYYENRMIEVIDGPARSGYSTTVEGAASDALAKLKRGLMDGLKEKIRVMK